MTEYIERTALYEVMNGQDCEFSLIDALALIEQFPAGDVVEVVRCRECVHYREHRTRRHKQLIRECVRMARHDMEYPVKSDDFCSYGQRKEAEHSDAHAPH